MVHGVHYWLHQGAGHRRRRLPCRGKGQSLTLTVGYSHPIDYELPAGITAKVENNTHIVVTGADKMLVGWLLRRFVRSRSLSRIKARVSST